MSTGAQYVLTGAQQAVNLDFETYEEMTDEMDVNRQATKAAIQQCDQVIQSQ